MSDWPLTETELSVIAVMRAADEHWLPEREITRRSRLKHRVIISATRSLHARGLLVKRRFERGMPHEVEVSFARRS